MKTRLLLVAPTFAIVIAFLLGCEKSSSPNLKETLLAALRQYLHACVNGDVESFRRLRDPEEIKQMEALLAARGEQISSENLRPKTPQVVLRILDYPIVQVTSNGDFARLAFLNENAAAMGHKPDEAEIVFVLFRKHDNIWKIVRFGPVVLTKSDLTAENHFAEEKVPPPFRLPD